MNDKKIFSKNFILILSFIIAAVLTPLFLCLYMHLSHTYTRKYAGNQVKISVSKEQPAHSGGRDMRIVFLKINGRKIDMSKYQNKDWVWHQEWGYTLYQSGDSDLIINSKDKITDFEMEYARQQASGNCTVSIGRSAIPIKMYSSSWISNTITVKFLNRVQIIFAGTEIFLIILLVLSVVS